MTVEVACSCHKPENWTTSLHLVAAMFYQPDPKMLTFKLSNASFALANRKPVGKQDRKGDPKARSRLHQRRSTAKPSEIDQRFANPGLLIVIKFTTALNQRHLSMHAAYNAPITCGGSCNVACWPSIQDPYVLWPACQYSYEKSEYQQEFEKEYHFMEADNIPTGRNAKCLEFHLAAFVSLQFPN